MTRVFVVGDIRLYREGLASRLGRLDDVEVTESAADDTLVERVRAEAPEILLLDMSSPRSLDLVRSVVRNAPDTRVVALAVLETEEGILPCAEAGIAGYVPRDGSLEDMVEVLESVRRGESIVSRRIAASLLKRVGTLASGEERGEVASALTPRETEIAGYLERGQSNKQIAKALGIRVPTVKNHVHAILGKLNVHRRAQVGEALRGVRKAPRWATARRARETRSDSTA